MKILAVLILAVTLGGCASQEAYQKYSDNTKVSIDRYYQAAEKPMVEFEGNCTGPIKFVVRQPVQYVAPQQIKDSEWVPVLNTAVGILGNYGNAIVNKWLGYGSGYSGTGAAGFVVTGDNNTFSGIGNSLEASGESSISAPFSSSNSFSWSTNNRDYTLGADTSSGGTVTDSGVVDTAEPVVTGDTVTTTDVITP